jgi:hypothetical protein
MNMKVKDKFSGNPANFTPSLFGEGLMRLIQIVIVIICYL